MTYDAFHGVWMAGYLGSSASFGFNGDDVIVSRSAAGTHWGKPVSVARAPGGSDYDSTWLNCDNWPSSPNYGHCYFEWDDFGQGNQLHISTSTDGGLTWTPASVPGGAIVIGGHPVSQPNGTVVVPIDDGFVSQAESFVSHDGGASFQGPFLISAFSIHTPGGFLRSLDIISSEVDVTGKVYVTWYDCRFRSGCSSNDIVMSTSTDGQHWSSPTRIPIDPTTSTVDHFLAGVAVEPGTSGSSAHLALVYWFYPISACSSNCKLSYGVIESSDGGATWSAATQIAGPFSLASLPLTSSGYMVGDYSSVSFAGSGASSVFAVAQKGTTCTQGQVGSCNEPMSVPTTPLAVAGPHHVASPDLPVAGWQPNVRHGALASAR